MTILLNIQILVLQQILLTYLTITYNTVNPIPFSTSINDAIIHINSNSQNSSPTPDEIMNISNPNSMMTITAGDAGLQNLYIKNILYYIFSSISIKSYRYYSKRTNRYFYE